MNIKEISYQDLLVRPRLYAILWNVALPGMGFRIELEHFKKHPDIPKYASFRGIIAYQDHKVLGWGRCYVNYRGELDIGVIVKEEYRRQGVGRSIVEYIKDNYPGPYDCYPYNDVNRAFFTSVGLLEEAVAA